MNVFDVIFNRRSVRKFRPDDVDDKLVGVMLASAVQAPSAGNAQEWHFVVVKDEEKRKLLSQAAFEQSFIAEAPVVIVVCMNLEKISMRFGKRGELFYGIQDTANATMVMMLVAEALGLSTCWVGAFDEDKVGHVAELPERFRAVAIVPVGYAAEDPEKPRRIDFEKLTSFNAYGDKFDIAYGVQPEPGREIRFTPLGNTIEDKLSKGRKFMQKRDRVTFSDFLKNINRKGQRRKREESMD